MTRHRYSREEAAAAVTRLSLPVATTAGLQAAGLTGAAQAVAAQAVAATTPQEVPRGVAARGVAAIRALVADKAADVDALAEQEL